MASPREQLAQRHVAEARRIVARQRRLIADLTRCNGYGQQEAKILAAFEKSLAIFEDDLASVSTTDDEIRTV